jgi:glycosyltransferase involved in cell wall biosynthesis
VASRSSSVKVSVVIPCYNSSAFLTETVQSVLAQTLRSFEVIFVDDGSQDETRTIVQSMMGAGSTCPMRLLCQQRSGVAAARNRGIAEAHGRYILPLDADDLIGPTMLEEVRGAGRRTGGLCGLYRSVTLEMWIRCGRRADAIGASQILYRLPLQHVQKIDVGAGRRLPRQCDRFDDGLLPSALLGFRASHGPPKARRHSASFMWRILIIERLLARLF